tara:strand:- start:1955 stop:2362 length:408 start_codon:yes stop_codon:yes gene_type:complete
MDAVVVPKASKKAKSKGKGPRRMDFNYTVGSVQEETAADRLAAKREAELKKHLNEKAREEIIAEFTAKATTAGPNGAAWSKAAAMAPVVEKEVHDTLPVPRSFEKPARTASTESVEDWELAADDEEQKPLGGWDI